MTVEPGTVVRNKTASRTCYDRTVVGEYDGYVYMRIGDNPHAVESCPSTIFSDVYMVKGDA